MDRFNIQYNQSSFSVMNMNMNMNMKSNHYEPQDLFKISIYS